MRKKGSPIVPATNGNSVSFSVHKPGQYSVEKPGTGAYTDEVLFVFANSPEQEQVKKTGKNLIYLEEGIHQRHIDLQSGQTLYLEAGAVLFGSVNVWNANNVSIKGRGVVMHYGPQSEDEDFGWINKKNWHCLTTNNVKGLTVSGVTFIGRSRTWTIQTHTTFDALFDNIKILAVNPQNINGDGIDWYGGGRAKVTNSLIKSMDDCFAFFTPSSSLDMWSETKLTEGRVTDIHIENCVLWTTLANVYRIGFKGQALVTDNVVMKNCDIIHFNQLTWQAPDSLGGKKIMIDWFKAARKNTEGVKLYLNEFTMFHTHGKGSDDFYNNVKMLLDGGAPIEGIGEQSHIGGTPPGIDFILKKLDRFASFGLPIQITEFDITSDDDDFKARYLRDYFTAVFSHPSTIGILQWGFWEGSHWMPAAALWDKGWNIRPAGKTFTELVSKTWNTNEQGSTGKNGVYKTRGFTGDYEVVVKKGAQTVSQQTVLTTNGQELVIKLKGRK